MCYSHLELWYKPIFGMYVLHRWYGESIGFHFLIADLKTTKKRSSHPRCFIKKGVLKNFAKFTRKFLCPSLFYNKIAGLATLLKKRLWHSFPVNFAKFLRIPILENICERLLLKKSSFLYLWDKLPWLFSVSRYWYKMLLFLTYLFYL